MYKQFRNYDNTCRIRGIKFHPAVQESSYSFKALVLCILTRIEYSMGPSCRLPVRSDNLLFSQKRENSDIDKLGISLCHARSRRHKNRINIQNLN